MYLIVYVPVALYSKLRLELTMSGVNIKPQPRYTLVKSVSTLCLVSAPDPLDRNNLYRNFCSLVETEELPQQALDMSNIRLMKPRLLQEKRYSP